MRKPSGPSLIFACTAILAAIAGAVEYEDVAFAEKMQHWAIVSAAFAVAFYYVIDYRLSRWRR